jgi:C4-dicarboxylate-specific signal transduction histidine kinase
MLDRVLLMLSELFVSDIVALFDARTENALHLVASIGLPAGSHHRRALAASPYAMAALSTGTPITVDRAREDADVDAFLHALDVESVAWLRVCGDSGRCRGVLVLARCRPLPFVRTDLDLIKTMAYRMGVMVERAHAEVERREMELKLRQAEKTESLGRMAAAIAHNFNNMLAVVMGSLEIALDTLPEEHSIRDDLLSA